MEVITNTKLVKSRGKLGTRLTWGGLLVLFSAIFLPLVSVELQTWSLGVMLVGFLLTNIGMYYFSRFVRPPMPQDILEQAMKGLDRRFRLYNYMGPVEYVLQTPTGVLAIALRRMGGPISCKGDRWSRKTSLVSKLRLFAEEQLGEPSLELRRDVTELQKLLEAKLPHEEAAKPVPIGGFIFFSDPSAVLTLDQPTVPVLQPRTIQDYLRRQGAGERLSQSQYEAVSAVLGGSAVPGGLGE